MRFCVNEWILSCHPALSSGSNRKHQALFRLFKCSHNLCRRCWPAELVPSKNFSVLKGKFVKRRLICRRIK